MSSTLPRKPVPSQESQLELCKRNLKRNHVDMLAMENTIAKLEAAKKQKAKEPLLTLLEKQLLKPDIREICKEPYGQRSCAFSREFIAQPEEDQKKIKDIYQNNLKLPAYEKKRKVQVCCAVSSILCHDRQG